MEYIGPNYTGHSIQFISHKRQTAWFYNSRDREIEIANGNSFRTIGRYIEKHNI
jgi:hypothetical protein